jgi:inosose dehydratase
MAIRVGTAPDSWGVWFASHPRQIHWQRYLREAAEAGYEWTELGPYGYLPTDLEVLRRELSENKLGVSGTFAMGHLEDSNRWPSLCREITDLCDIVRRLDGRFLVLIDDTYTDLFTGEQTRTDRLTGDDWKRLISRVNDAARVVQGYGLTLVFHPHAETHIEYEEQIEALLDQTDPASVMLCLDTGHHAYRGGDPVQFLERHHRRIPYLHLKNVDPELQARVTPERIPFAKAVEMGMFCEPAKGVVRFERVRDALHRINFDGWVIVEQDMFPTDFDRPLPIATRTRNYLRTIGIG